MNAKQISSLFFLAGFSFTVHSEPNLPAYTHRSEGIIVATRSYPPQKIQCADGSIRNIEEGCPSPPLKQCQDGTITTGDCPGGGSRHGGDGWKRNDDPPPPSTILKEKK